MPELPEVETTRRGILPHITGRILTEVIVKTPKLRYPVPQPDIQALIGQPVIAVNRRAKYLLIHFADMSLIIHLGMSGSLRILTQPEDHAWRTHDHWQLRFGDTLLRYHDPRRFGFMLTSGQPKEHPLLVKLAPEPLGDDFNIDYLTNICKKTRSVIKNVIMNPQLVVGVGNIYACESLFMARIHPQRPANTLTPLEIQRLYHAILHNLTKAIAQGGTTLRDFVQPDGRHGYFAQTLNVYGREGQACPVCKTVIDNIKIGGRSSCYCPRCQPKDTSNDR